VQDLASIITTVESLIKFKKESSKGEGKKTEGSSKGGEDWHKSPKRGKPYKDI